MSTATVRQLLQHRNEAQMLLRQTKGDEATHDRLMRKVGELTHALSRAGMTLVQSQDIDFHTAMLKPPLGPGLSSENATTATRLVVWGTKFDHPGPDFCMMCVEDNTGKHICVRHVDGY